MKLSFINLHIRELLLLVLLGAATAVAAAAQISNMPLGKCPLDYPVSPHNAQSFNRDFAELYADVVLDFFPASIPFEKRLLVVAQAYAESQDKMKTPGTGAYRPKPEGNTHNLQYASEVSCPGKCKYVWRNECLDDDNNPTTPCQYRKVYVYVPSFENDKEEITEYLRFVKKYQVNINEKLTKAGFDAIALLDAMKSFGTDPNYRKNLKEATPQVLKVISDFSKERAAAYEKVLQCLNENGGDQSSKDVAKKEQQRYESVRQAADSLINKLAKSK